MTNSIYDSLSKYLIAGLLYSGGSSQVLLEKILYQRIDDLYQTTLKDKPFNIYEDENHQKKGQKVSKKPIKAEYYQGNRLRLPLIYDIFVFYHIYKKSSQSMVGKIDAIIDYIASDAYQKLDYGYGLIKSHKSSYHQVGWSAHLPLFTPDLSSDYFRKGLLFRMYLFSRFDNDRVKKWLNKNIIELNKYKIDHFRYCFPSTILVQEKNNYFMNGRQMGLSENRRIKETRIVESTYYMYQIQKNMNDSIKK